MDCHPSSYRPAGGTGSTGIRRNGASPGHSAPFRGSGGSGDSAIQLVRLAVADLGRLEQASGELLAHRVDVDAAGLPGVARVGVVDVDVEDEGVVALALEPVDVVLVVGDGGGLARLERPVDGGLDDVVVL